MDISEAAKLTTAPAPKRVANGSSRTYRFFFISLNGDSLPMAYALAEEGHTVYFYHQVAVFKRASCLPGQGMVEAVRLDHPLVRRDYSLNDRGLSSIVGVDPDVFIVDHPAFDHVAEYLVGRGHTVIGGGRTTHDVCMDRWVESKMMARASIGMPPTWFFSDHRLAMDYVRDKHGIVIKNRDGRFLDTVIAKSPETAVQLLKDRRRPRQFLIQDIVKGQDFLVCGWFGENLRYGPYALMWEDSIKVQVGGRRIKTSAFAKFFNENQPVFDSILYSLVDYLGSFNGPLVVRCKLDETGNAVPVSFRTGFAFSWPTLLMQALEVPLGDFLAAMAGLDQMDAPSLVTTDFVASASAYSVDPVERLRLDSPSPSFVPNVVYEDAFRHGASWYTAGVTGVVGHVLASNSKAVGVRALINDVSKDLNWPYTLVSSKGMYYAREFADEVQDAGLVTYDTMSGEITVTQRVGRDGAFLRDRPTTPLKPDKPVEEPPLSPPVEPDGVPPEDDMDVGMSGEIVPNGEEPEGEPVKVTGDISIPPMEPLPDDVEEPEEGDLEEPGADDLEEPEDDEVSVERPFTMIGGLSF